MSSVAEKPAADNPQPPLDPAAKAGRPPRSRRWRKETLLPEITQLALEGHTGQTIGRKLGLPKRTVNRWLHELRQEWTAKAAEGAGKLFAVELARLDAIYREAMQAWRASQAEMEVRLVEDTSGARGDPKKKNSVRTQPPRRNAALLTRATAAVMASCRLKGRAAPRPVKPADPDEERIVCGLRIPKAGTIESDKWWLSNSLDGLWEMDLADLYETAQAFAKRHRGRGRHLPRRVGKGSDGDDGRGTRRPLLPIEGRHRGHRRRRRGRGISARSRKRSIHPRERSASPSQFSGPTVLRTARQVRGLVPIGAIWFDFGPPPVYGIRDTRRISACCFHPVFNWFSKVILVRW